MARREQFKVTICSADLQQSLRIKASHRKFSEPKMQHLDASI